MMIVIESEAEFKHERKKQIQKFKKHVGCFKFLKRKQCKK